jgi:hypothetical protein
VPASCSSTLCCRFSPLGSPAYTRSAHQASLAAEQECGSLCQGLKDGGGVCGQGPERQALSHACTCRRDPKQVLVHVLDMWCGPPPRAA